MSEKWEVVGNKKKTFAHTNGDVKHDKKNKQDKQQAFDKNAPKIDKIPALDESESQFDAFIIHEQKQQKQPKSPKKDKPPKVKKTEKVDNTPKKPSTLDEALTRLEDADVLKLLDEVKERFPNAHLIWLKDICSYLNIKLDPDDKEPGFLGMGFDYPMSLLAPSVLSHLNKLVAECPLPVLKLFFEQCVDALVKDISKDIPSVGCQLMSALMLKKHPAIMMSNVSKVKVLVQQHEMRNPGICLRLLWIAAQAGVSSLKEGLTVWLELMAPLVASKNFSHLTVQYAEHLFNIHQNPADIAKHFTSDHFLMVQDLVYKHSLPSNLDSRLLWVYPKIKNVLFGPPKSLKNFFIPLLSRLQPGCDKPYKTELITCLLHVLSLDSKGFHVWRSVPQKYIEGSSILLQHIQEHWSQLHTSLSHSELDKTKNSLNVKLKHLEAKGKLEPGMERAAAACNALETQMQQTQKSKSSRSPSSSSGWFPWRTANVCMILLLAVLVMQDITKHGSFKASRTGVFLNQTGTLKYVEQGLQVGSQYSHKALTWWKVNKPEFVDEAVVIVTPYFHTAYDQLLIVTTYLIDAANNLQAYIKLKYPQVLAWIEMQYPGLITTVSDFCSIVCEAIVDYTLLFVQMIIQYANIAYKWTMDKVDVELLQSYYSQAEKLTLQYYDITYTYLNKVAHISVAWVNEQVKAFSA